MGFWRRIPSYSFPVWFLLTAGTWRSIQGWPTVCTRAPSKKHSTSTPDSIRRDREGNVGHARGWEFISSGYVVDHLYDMQVGAAGRKARLSVPPVRTGRGRRVPKPDRDESERCWALGGRGLA